MEDGNADATMVVVAVVVAAVGTAVVVVAEIVDVVGGVAVFVERAVEDARAGRVAKAEKVVSAAEGMEARRRGSDGCGARSSRVLCMVAASSSSGTRKASCVAPGERIGGYAVAQLIES